MHRVCVGADLGVWVWGVCMYVYGRVRVSPLYVWTGLSQDVFCI